MFLETLDKYPNSQKICTDGTLQEDKSGSAFVWNNENQKFNLGKSATVNRGVFTRFQPLSLKFSVTKKVNQNLKGANHRRLSIVQFSVEIIFNYFCVLCKKIKNSSKLWKHNKEKDWFFCNWLYWNLWESGRVWSAGLARDQRMKNGSWFRIFPLSSSVFWNSWMISTFF